ncbi:hypothetical protein [Methylobacter sp. sgz302048]|uniref:hypothetical protein n=1 Tax=Methylobacter sp. sgz302048 TaxID=3455945 RepID=UPI003F9F0484
MPPFREIEVTFTSFASTFPSLTILTADKSEPGDSKLTPGALADSSKDDAAHCKVMFKKLPGLDASRTARTFRLRSVTGRTMLLLCRLKSDGPMIGEPLRNTEALLTRLLPLAAPLATTIWHGELPQRAKFFVIVSGAPVDRVNFWGPKTTV